MTEKSKNIAFEKLFREQYKPLCYFAYRYIGDMEAAHEVVQEAYVALWEKGAFNRSLSSLKSYLFTVVKNSCINLIERNSSQNRYRKQIMLDYIQECTVYHDDLVAKELHKKIADALALLPEQCHKIFMLSRHKQLKYNEIAKTLSISIKTVEAQMSKALRIMRHELADYLFAILLFFTSF